MPSTTAEVKTKSSRSTCITGRLGSVSWASTSGTIWVATHGCTTRHPKSRATPRRCEPLILRLVDSGRRCRRLTCHQPCDQRIRWRHSAESVVGASSVETIRGSVPSRAPAARARQLASMSSVSMSSSMPIASIVSARHQPLEPPKMPKSLKTVRPGWETA